MAAVKNEIKIETLLAAIESLLSGMHQQQALRAQKVAQRLRPELTAEDILNPDNFAQIISDPDFMYEDGQAAGILAAKIAVRALLKEQLGS